MQKYRNDSEAPQSPTVGIYNSHLWLVVYAETGTPKKIPHYQNYYASALEPETAVIKYECAKERISP